MTDKLEDYCLAYIDHDGLRHEVKGCHLTADRFDRYEMWCEQLEERIVYRTKGRENALIAAIDSLLFTIHLHDKRIADLRRIANLAKEFADAVKSHEEDGGH